MWWDITRPLSYNKLFNFIVGPRGGGKTYGAKEFAIKNFLKRNAQFVYLRRYETEFEKVSKFFDDITGRFSECTFKVDGGKFIIDKQEAGYYMALSKAKAQKSTPFPLVTDIIFDEFILDRGYHHYLPDEVTSFLEFYSTIARLRDVRVWFLSNALTITNPYFLYFDINLPYGKDIAVKGDILIQLVNDAEYKEVASNTRFGKLVANTAYGEYAIDNQFLRDDTAFLAKKPVTSYYKFTLIYKEKEFGVWMDRDMGLYYVSEDVDKYCPFRYSVTLEDHKPNMLLLKTVKPVVLNTFLKAYSVGCVRFENVNIKNMCQEIIKLTI